MATIGEVRSRLRAGPPRRVRLWSQRFEEPPYLNCRYFGWLSQAWWAGLRWDGGNATALAITDLLRKHSGRPEFIAGEAQGSTAADLDRALAAVFPWMRVTHRMVTDAELLEHLGSRYVAGVAVWLPDLPARKQRFTGSGRIGHYVRLMGSRVPTREVRYLDPLGSLPYGGDWVPFGAIRPALMQRSGGSTFCSLMEVGDPMLTTVEVVRAFAGGGATATLPKGSVPTFRIKPGGGGDFERVRDVALTTPTPIRVGYVAKVAKVPSRGPQGRFYFVSDGPMAGRFIRASATALTEPDTGDAGAAYQRGLTDGRLEAEAGFRPIALPDDVYQRVDA